MLAVLSKQNKTKQNKTKSNKQNTVKSTMNVITDITVSVYLLQRCLAGSPKLGKKKPQKLILTDQMRHKNCIPRQRCNILQRLDHP